MNKYDKIKKKNILLNESFVPKKPPKLISGHTKLNLTNWLMVAFNCILKLQILMLTQY